MLCFARVSVWRVALHSPSDPKMQNDVFSVMPCMSSTRSAMDPCEFSYMLMSKAEGNNIKKCKVLKVMPSSPGKAL